MHDDEAAGGRSQERHGHLGHRLSPRSAKHSPKELMSATEDVSFENPLETGSSEPRALAELDIEAALKAGTLTEAQAIVQIDCADGEEDAGTEGAAARSTVSAADVAC
jgi:hypothetical protein